MDQEHRALRDCLGCFATGVTVVSTQMPDGTLSGVTVNSFSSVSLDPPLILFCLGNDSFSTSLFQEADHFAVNILTKEQESISRHFAGHTADEADSKNKWDNVSYQLSDHGLPLIGETLALMQCKKIASYPGGDHTIFLGEIIDFSTADTQAQPLLYIKGRYK